MATTATLVSINGTSFPYIGTGVPAAQQPTMIPSAEVLFQSDATITVAAAGEDQSLLIQCHLPRSFCWVLVESTFRLSSIAGDNWDSECVSSIFDSGAAATVIVPIHCWANPAGDGLAHQAGQKIRTFTADPVPQKMIVPLADDNARFDIFLENNTIDGAVGSIRFYARFLRYDRNQAQHWQVNTPVLIR